MLDESWLVLLELLELLGVLLVDVSVDEVVLDGVDESVVDGVAAGVVDGVVDGVVEEGVAFGSVCEVVAAPLPGEAAVLSFAVDCECETPTAAVSAAANATELQVRDLFIQ